MVTTSRQAGASLGIAPLSTIAATAASRYRCSHHAAPMVVMVHGLSVAAVVAAIILAGAAALVLALPPVRPRVCTGRCHIGASRLDRTSEPRRSVRSTPMISEGSPVAITVKTQPSFLAAGRDKLTLALLAYSLIPVHQPQARATAPKARLVSPTEAR